MLNYTVPSLPLWSQMDADQIREALADIHHAKIKLAADTTLAVAHARRLGLTWEDIGRELNMTRQAAWEQWRHVEPA